MLRFVDGVLRSLETVREGQAVLGHPQREFRVLGDVIGIDAAIH